MRQEAAKNDTTSESFPDDLDHRSVPFWSLVLLRSSKLVDSVSGESW